MGVYALIPFNWQSADSGYSLIASTDDISRTHHGIPFVASPMIGAWRAFTAAGSRRRSAVELYGLFLYVDTGYMFKRSWQHYGLVMLSSCDGADV